MNEDLIAGESETSHTNRFIVLLNETLLRDCCLTLRLKVMTTIENEEDMMIMRGMVRTNSNLKKDLLFKHVVTDEKSVSMLKAYKLRSTIIKTLPKKEDLKIRSYDRLPLIIEKKFDHHPSAVIPHKNLSKRQQEVINKYSKHYITNPQLTMF